MKRNYPNKETEVTSRRARDRMTVSLVGHAHFRSVSCMAIAVMSDMEALATWAYTGMCWEFSTTSKKSGHIFKSRDKQVTIILIIYLIKNI